MAKQVLLTEMAEQNLEIITDYLAENWENKVCDKFLVRFEKNML
jgi:plasmid stabilization system protein ParE